jgi:uncharacterized protein
MLPKSAPPTWINGSMGSPGKWLVLLLLAAGLVVPQRALRADNLRALPPIRSRLVDETLTLTMDQRDALLEILTGLETEKGAQVALVIVPTTRPEAIEAYSLRLAEAWKLGRKGVDDGVLIVVAKDDRRARIEVGYGLEGAIPDALAKDIVADTMAPAFKEGEFFRGLDEGLQQVELAIRGENLPAPSQGELPDDGPKQGFWFWTLTIVGLVAGVVLWIGLYRRGFVRFMIGVAAGGGMLALAHYGLHDIFAGIFGAFFLVTLGGGLGGLWVIGAILSLIGGGGGSSSWGGGGGSFGGGGASGNW